jgi:nucleotide-binding universal stress UspA family protein
MAYRDLLLAALTYPDVTPERALRSGVALARRLGGQLDLLALKVDIPALDNRLANAVLKFDEVSQQKEAESAATAQLQAAFVRVAAEEADVVVRTLSRTVRLFDECEAICQAARTRDLSLVPVGPSVAADQNQAEALLFGSGRPVLIYPEAVEITPASRFGRIAIAWDGSARAARAVGDALPALVAAQEVRIFVALGEKTQVAPGAAQDLVRHLQSHGVTATVDEREAAADVPIGRRLADYVLATEPDLLVMGGFGHARLREFILGGATRAVLEAPPCPVLISH